LITTSKIRVEYGGGVDKYSAISNRNNITHSGKLDIGRDGFILDHNYHTEVRGGYLTSSSGVINIHATVQIRHVFQIRDGIINSGYSRVGLNITASPDALAEVEFEGNTSNTFTGDTTIIGNVGLYLIKRGGGIGISGNLNIRDGASVGIYDHEQIANHVRASLISRGKVSTLKFGGSIYPGRTLNETIHELVVEGNGAIDFGSTDSDSVHGPRFLYLDDLIIGNGSTLQILGWRDKRDYLLVRKNSWNLEDALKKIEFDGYNRNNIHKEDFNRDYWAISAAPEPSTYGILLIAIAAALPLLRNRLRCTSTLRMTRSFERLGTKCVRYSYSKMVTTLASVRRRMSSGTCSKKRAIRSCKSTTLG